MQVDQHSFVGHSLLVHRGVVEGHSLGQGLLRHTLEQTVLVQGLGDRPDGLGLAVLVLDQSERLHRLGLVQDVGTQVQVHRHLVAPHLHLELVVLVQPAEVVEFVVEQHEAVLLAEGAVQEEEEEEHVL